MVLILGRDDLCPHCDGQGLAVCRTCDGRWGRGPCASCRGEGIVTCGECRPTVGVAAHAWIPAAERDDIRRAVVACMPATSLSLSERLHLPRRRVRAALRQLRAVGLATQDGRRWLALDPPDPSPRTSRTCTSGRHSPAARPLGPTSLLASDPGGGVAPSLTTKPLEAP